jgi:hypothetical protein
MRDITDREFLEYLYRTMPWRICGRDEFNTWIMKTDDGFTWEDVLKDFTNSNLFHHRVREIINSVVAESYRLIFRERNKISRRA